jgi:16S rRNA (uracil1498-N3)-methyltransferase
VIPRVLAPAAGGSDEEVVLPVEEAHHLLRVLRLAAGSPVRVFDGRGREWQATVASAAGGSVRLRVGAPVTPAPEPPARTVLGVAVLKGTAMDRVVRDAAMVGAAAIQPLLTTHVAAASAGARSPGAQARWQRIAVASVKQCGRAVVPTVQPAVDLASWLDGVRAEPAVKIALAEPRREAGRRLEVPALAARAASSGAMVLSGPEGGWSADELDAAGRAGFASWTVSGRILRAEAVPVAALALLFYLWEVALTQKRNV